MSRFVPYHAESVNKAKELTQDMATKIDKFRAITNYINRTISYDYIRAIQIQKKNGMPDVERCWRLRMGICFDIAALTTGMLRAVGIHAYLCVGKADRQNHAWVEATINNKKYRYDRSGRAQTYKTERRY